MLQHRCPIYQQQRCRSLGEAAAATDKLSAKDGSNPPRVSLEAFLQENLSRGVVIGAETVLCFYDSEFGMYNYGELQGDVVSMGAVVLPPKSAAGQEPDSKAAQRAEAEAGTVETQNTQNTEPENTEPEMLQKENALPLRFASLVRNTDETQLAERFQMFTHLSPQALSEAPDFSEVYPSFRSFVEAHGVEVIFCLGNNDQERLGAMMEQYGFRSEADRALLLKFHNFQRWLRRYDERLSGFSLESLKELCGVTEEVLHDAFDDASALARVYERLTAEHPTDKQINLVMEAGKQRSRYRKSRRISFERLQLSPALCAQKDALVEALRAENAKTHAVPAGVLRALCDDLDALLS